jgi:hypothetical protein
MRKREIKFGEVVPGTYLLALGPLPSDAHGNQIVRVRCELCGTEKPMRATAMTMRPFEDQDRKTRRPNKSCGCLSRAAHAQYWETRAKGIRRRVQRRIFLGHQTAHKSFKTLADDYDMPEQLASTIFRLYARRLKERGRLR